MEGRGKKSIASLEVVQNQQITAFKRPEPPARLTNEQAEIWLAVVNNQPADWFKPDTHELLEHYTRHAVAGRRIDEMIKSLPDSDDSDWLNTLNKLYIMQEREGRAMTSLATKMRITQQSEYTHKTKRDKAPVRKPWE